MAGKEKKGLGTGLGVLFGEDRYHDENELKLLPVGKLEPRQDQPRSVRLSEAPSHGIPGVVYDRAHRGSRAYTDLAREFIARCER